MTGTAVTFYSYKGGVGRTFALANVGALLASWDYRVLCLDWDLEAPGLTFYLGVDATSPGLLEMVEGVARGEIPASAVVNVRPARVGTGRLDLLPAGRQDSTYARRLQALDWQTLYREHDFGAVLEEWRAEWKRSYDFVLIDSRTGITDIGGICTVALPDLLVLVFTASEQSVNGVLSTLDLAMAAHNRLPFDRPRLRALPLPSRFDEGVEYERAEKWRVLFEQKFARCYRDWAVDGVPIKDLIGPTTIPYSAYWSFGEDLPALHESIRDPAYISHRFATVAALIARGLDDTDLLVESRDTYVEGAIRMGRRRSGFAYDVYLSFNRETATAARDLTAALRGAGISVLDTSTHAIEHKPAGSSGRDDALELARHLVVVLGDEFPSDHQEREVQRFLRRTLDDNVSRSVLPVLTTARARRSMPSYLQRMQSIQLDRVGIGGAAQLVERALVEDELPLLERSLNDRERLIGPNHPDTLTARNNLASFYQAAGRTTDAVALAEEVLADFERLLGFNHPDTLTARNNLASFYRASGRVAEALPLLERTLTEREHLLGPDHPDTLASRINLGSAYADAGRVAEAIALLQRSVADAERLLGPDNAETLRTRTNLASAYRTAGRLADALPLREHSVTDAERLLGPDHPDTLASRTNLASAYADAGRLAEAIALLEQGVADAERLLGPDNPATLRTRTNLGIAYANAGRLAEAIASLERSVADAERLLGPDNPATLRTRTNLGIAYANAGRLAEAIASLERSVADAERLLGPDNPDTLARRTHLASAYLNADRSDEALVLLEDAVARSGRVLGPDDSRLAVPLYRLGRLQQQRGHLSAAVDALARAVAVDTAAYGSDHPEVATDLEALAEVHEQAGDQEAAEESRRRAERIRRPSAGRPEQRS